MTSPLPPLTWSQKIGYATGAAGWVAVDRLLLTWALFFYLPPEDTPLPARLPAWSLLGFITLWGGVSVGGRILDAVTDPLAASWSDRSRHPFGRRRIFMAVGALPTCLLASAVFFPWHDGPAWSNAAYVAVVMCGFYLALTVFSVPYHALLPELGRVPAERLQISTLQAVLQLIAAGIVMVLGPELLSLFGERLPDGTVIETARAYQATALILSAFALTLMGIPLVAVDEPSLCAPATPSSTSTLASLQSVLRSRDLRWYLLGTTAYWFGFNTVASGSPYYVTVLLSRPASFTGRLLMAPFLTALVILPWVPRLTRRLGRRRCLIVGALFQAVIMVQVAFVRDAVTGVLLMGLAGIPTAFLMAIPNAVLCDLAEADTRASGQKREAMVFATQAFFLKVNLGLSSAALAALLQVGRSVEQPLGVQLSGPFAAGVLLISAFAYARLKDPAEAFVPTSSPRGRTAPTRSLLP